MEGLEDKGSECKTVAGDLGSAEEWLAQKKYPRPGSEPGCSGPEETEKGGLGLAEWVAWVEQQGLVGLTDEFTLMGMSESGPLPAEEARLACRQADNRPKNRHQDVICLDESRVVLKDGLPGDYIHASFVDGFRRPKGYICTQAPLDETRVDFWRLVWQEKVGTIVMVTRMQETTEKATPYWPITHPGKIRYGPLVVSNLHVSNRGNYVLTELSVHNLRTEEKRPCYHLYYTDWPDHCIPLFMKGFLHFMERVRQLNHFFTKRLTETEGGSGVPSPVLVHCSAGIGRTGTFVAIDLAFAHVVVNRRLDLQAILRRLRRQRHGSVQTAHQFLFAHVVILYLLKSEHLFDTASVVNPDKVLRNFTWT